MAMIGGQAPTPDARFSPNPQRVVVKLAAATAGPPPDARESATSDTWSALLSRYPNLRVSPYFEDAAPPGPGLRAEATEPAGYLAVDVPPNVNVMEVATLLLEAPEVEIAYPEGGPTPPPVNAADDPLSANQAYLDAAPGGIDARWTWDNAPSDGSLVGVIDLEQGWTLNHEDLADAGVALVSGTNTAYHGHGTAVLGEIIGVDNTAGVIGIAPRANGRVVSQFRPDGRYSTADAIRSAIAVMAPGDVLLLEAQTTYPTVSGFVPVEVEAVVFDAIVLAVSRGIIVVEAGGNGAVDLDTFRDLRGRQILNRASPDFQDSGAIVVGAASSGAPHRRLSFSNHGSRIDCYAWGEHIQTTGDGWMGTSPTVYTTSFGGTSGASPIVTGAALLLQAWRDRNGLPRYSAQQMRVLLSDPALNTSSAVPASDRIGAMPDLRAIIERERIATPRPPLPSEVRVVT
jgi:hypothetical protein